MFRCTPASSSRTLHFSVVGMYLLWLSRKYNSRPFQLHHCFCCQNPGVPSCSRSWITTGVCARAWLLATSWWRHRPQTLCRCCITAAVSGSWLCQQADSTRDGWVACKVGPSSGTRRAVSQYGPPLGVQLDSIMNLSVPLPSVPFLLLPCFGAWPAGCCYGEAPFCQLGDAAHLGL